MATIKLYSQCKVTEEKNFQLDGTGIQTYLNTLQVGGKSKTYSDTQYIKHSLNIKVKVVLNESYLEPIFNNYNYCDIVNDGGTHVYYFIKGMEWAAKDTVVLDLKMDVLNTFQGKYTFNNKTTIQRQHKDRFKTKSDYKGYANATLVYRSALTRIVPINPTQIDPCRYEYIFQLDDSIDNRTITITYKDIKGGVANFSYTISGDVATLVWKGPLLNPETLPNIGPFISIDVTYGQKSGTIQQTRIRNIDYVAEDINPTLFGKTIGNLQDNLFAGSWYMIYAGSTAINAYIVYDEPITIKNFNATGLTMAVSDLTEGQSYYLDFGELTLADPNEDEVKKYNKILKFGTSEYQTYKGKTPEGTFDAYVIEFWRVSGTLHVQYWAYELHNGKWYGQGKVGPEGQYTDITTLNFDITPDKYKLYIYHGVQHLTSRSNIRSLPTIEKTKTATDYTLDSIWNVSKNSGDTQTIIALPYCPFEYEADYTATETSGIKTIYITDYNGLSQATYQTKTTEGESEIVTSSTKVLQINNPEVFLKNNTSLIMKNHNNISNPIWNIVSTGLPASIVGTESRDDTFESKIYHSQFYQPKLVYDNFSWVYKLELTNQENPYIFCDLDYKVSGMYKSKFIFEVKDFTSDLQEQDYNNIMYVSRNNAIPLYTSAYLDYMRTAYNYDVKQKQYAIFSTSANALGNTIIGGAIGGGPGVASGAVSGVSAALGTAYTSQLAIDKTRAQLDNQAANVRNCDDFDMFDYYSNNKLKMVLYTPNDNDKKQILDLFYYCGYKCSYQGIPDTTSRIWFNFIQCQPVFNVTSTTANLDKDILNELKLKYNEGVTVLHKQNNTWDFAQVKENWESNLFS